MELPAIDLIELFYALLPGFLAASVFHSLTPYPKRDVLDRVVTALMFTLCSQLCIAAMRPVLFWLGREVGVLGEWSPMVELAWGAVFGVSLGLVWSHAINKGHTHEWLRKRGATKRTSLPTQWYSAFSKYDRFIILHFADGRRLMGWPIEWPDEPESGHFLLQCPEWVMKDGSKAAMHKIEVLLVSAKDVVTVEFLRFSDDPVLQEQKAAIDMADAVLTKAREEATDEQGQPAAASSEEREQLCRSTTI